MKIITITDKESYLKKNYPRTDVPEMTDERFCLHCRKKIIVGDFKVELQDDMEFIVCPNAPDCNGTAIDWMPVDWAK